MRKKTKKEVRADVINATEEMNTLHKISANFINTFMECDGDVFFSEAIRLRDAVWRVDSAKRRVEQDTVSANYSAKSTHISNYEE